MLMAINKEQMQEKIRRSSRKKEMSDIELGFKQKDQFFTPENIVIKCLETFYSVAKKYEFNLNEYTFIESSAGNGAFYKKLPRNRRIGLDIDPTYVCDESKEIIKQDFLSWYPKEKKKYAIIGNPPFGVWGGLVTEFINHAQRIDVDILGFIMPRSTIGIEKIKHIKDFELVHKEQISDKDVNFLYPNNKICEIRGALFCVFIRKNKHLIKREIKSNTYKSSKEFLEMPNIVDASTYVNKLSYQNMDLIKYCDFFIGYSCYPSQIKLVKTFQELKDINVTQSIGFIIKKNKKEISEILQNLDFKSVIKIGAAGNCWIKRDEVDKILIKAGFYKTYYQDNSQIELL